MWIDSTSNLPVPSPAPNGDPYPTVHPCLDKIDNAFVPLDPLTRVRAWAGFLKDIRHFFDSRGFWEVTTESLIPSSAIDAVLDPIKVHLKTQTLELQTSPEFEMKWWLAETHLPIYQICKSFREDPPSPIHRKEFTMLEFYQPHCDISVTADQMKGLIEAVVGKRVPFEDSTVGELVRKITGVDIFTDRDNLARQLMEKARVDFSADDSWDDLFFRLMIEKVEPVIGQEVAFLLRDFPATLSSLSVVEGNPPVAKRFEIYWKGMELCNGFNELLDVDLMLARYKHEQRLRIQQGKPPHPFPERLRCAMEKGIPPSSGVAVGLDRLFACVVSERYSKLSAPGKR